MIAIRSGGMFLAIAAVRLAAAKSGGLSSGRIAEAAAALVTGTLAVLVGLRAKQVPNLPTTITPTNLLQAPSRSGMPLPTSILPPPSISNFPEPTGLARIGAAPSNPVAIGSAQIGPEVIGPAAILPVPTDLEPTSSAASPLSTLPAFGRWAELNAASLILPTPDGPPASDSAPPISAPTDPATTGLAAIFPALAGSVSTSPASPSVLGSGLGRGFGFAPDSESDPESDSASCSTLRRLGTAVLFGLAAGFLAPGAVSAAVLAAAGFACGYVVAGRAAAAKSAKALQRRLAAAPPAIELFAAGLAAGMLPEQAALAVVDAFGRASPDPAADPSRDPLAQVAETFRQAAEILTDTADPVLAWAVLRRDPATEPVGTAALRSSRTGAPIAEAVSRAARATRDAARQAAQGQVRSVAVKAVAPLALCFLPAFILIGIVPTALGLLHQFER